MLFAFHEKDKLQNDYASDKIIIKYKKVIILHSKFNAPSHEDIRGSELSFHLILTTRTLDKI